MGACGAFLAARAEARGGMPDVRACRRALRPVAWLRGLAYARLGLAAGQPPATTKGGAYTATSGRGSALARARGTVKCCQNRGHVKSDSAVK